MRRTLLLALLLLSTSPPAEAKSWPVAEEWRTTAERSAFRSTSTLAETMDFLNRIAAADPAVHLSTFGVSESGRPLPLVIFADGIEPTPEASRAANRPIVFLICAIHPGEMDGKDAVLMLLRDHALGFRPGFAAETTLLIAPIYNVDGHENVSPLHRPTQNGPVDGAGFRTTNRGLDLNRDFMKLDSAEGRALTALFNEWRPHLVVDNHVTNGSDHDWVLTWSAAEAPELATSLDAWMRSHMPAVEAATEARGHPCGPYVSLVDRNDPAKGFDSNVSDPRYSSGYFPLRNRPTILVEMHSHNPFFKRVPANRDFLAALIAEVENAGTELIAAVHAAEKRTTDLGRPAADPSRIVLTWTTAPEADSILFPAKAWRLEDSVVMGIERVVFDPSRRHPVEVPWFHTRVPALEDRRPRGYLVLPGWPQIESHLAAHGLLVHRLHEPLEIDVETLRLANAVFATTSYQGRIRVEAEVSKQFERRNLPAGTLWVPAAQPDFELAVQLLEPEAPDSLFRWGELNSALERKVWIGPDDLEAFAREQLEEPDVQHAWRTALEDEGFAADPGRRYLWWYRRTPHWDETVGLLPIMRLHNLPETFPETRR